MRDCARGAPARDAVINTDSAKTVLLDSFHRKRAKTPSQPLAWLLFAVFALASCAPRQPAGNSIQPIQMKGMELYYGVVPAELLLDHPKAHEERLMHKGVALEKGAHHLVISVFDSKTAARITDATLTGSASEPGKSTEWKPLEIMSFGDAVSYGNYFDMPKPGPYEIVVKVRRPGELTHAVGRSVRRQLVRIASVNTRSQPPAIA